MVRIGEGHYGNADDTCFSAMEVVKLHGVQRVDMVIAQGLVSGPFKKVKVEGSRFILFPMYQLNKTNFLLSINDQDTSHKLYIVS